MARQMGLSKPIFRHYTEQRRASTPRLGQRKRPTFVDKLHCTLEGDPELELAHACCF